MQYIHRFETDSEYQQKRNNDYKEPWVSYTEETEEVNYNKEKTLIDMPLTFEIVSGGNVYWKAYNSGNRKAIEYSKDGGETWTSITSTTAGVSIPVNAGDTIQFKGDNATYSTSNYYYNVFSGSTAKIIIKGNIMSLIDSTGFTTATTLSSAYTFDYMFARMPYVIDASKLMLPAATLTNGCYRGMFRDCRSLTIGPNLPATTLAEECYGSMFRETGLESGPNLNAVDAVTKAYQYMFSGCTSLTDMPQIQAEQYGNEACYGMFADCRSLTGSTPLHANRYYGRDACKLMFVGCTALTAAPEIPEVSLGDVTYNIFDSMFSGCSSLSYIKCLINTSLSSLSIGMNWVAGVASSGTFVKKSGVTHPSGVSGIPTNWTVQDA